jgi:hypothetical protein
VRADAVRLQRWEAFKLRVRFSRLRDSWVMKHHRDEFGRALDGGTAVEFGNIGGKQGSKGAAAAAAQRAFEAAILTAAMEEGAELLPWSVHIWRMGQAGAVAAEGLTLASLAFAHNAWWGANIAVAGRALGFIFKVPAAYAVTQLSAALLVFALLMAQLARPIPGRPPPLCQRLLRLVCYAAAGLWRHTSVHSTQEVAIRKAAVKYVSRGGGDEGEMLADPSSPQRGGAAQGAAYSPVSGAVSPARNTAGTRGGTTGTPAPAMRPAPAWAVSPGRTWSDSPAAPGVGPA